MAQMQTMMDASYDDVKLQVEVFVRVYSARITQPEAIIFFDFYGRAAQITIPSVRPPGASDSYETVRAVLHGHAENLHHDSPYFRAQQHTNAAAEIESILATLMYGVAAPWPEPARYSDEGDRSLLTYELTWFLFLQRLQYRIEETSDHFLRVVAPLPEEQGRQLPRLLPQQPGLDMRLPRLATAPLAVRPMRMGKDRIIGVVTTPMTLKGDLEGACAQDRAAAAAAAQHEPAAAVHIRLPEGPVCASGRQHKPQEPRVADCAD